MRLFGLFIALCVSQTCALNFLLFIGKGEWENFVGRSSQMGFAFPHIKLNPT